MSETLNQTRDRLENIRSVEPILGALRTIAMGSWKAALNRRGWALEYAGRISQITTQILPLLQRPQTNPLVEDAARRSAQVTALVIGSERGLCAAFNRVLAEHTRHYLAEAARCGEQVNLQVAGTRAARVLQRTGIHPDRILKFAATTLPPFKMAGKFTQDWLLAYEAGELDRVDVIYNAYLGVGRYEARVIRLLPPQGLLAPAGGAQDIWPEPIIETDAYALFASLISQQLATRLYACLLESSASENSARFQLLEDARLNTERLVEELEAETAQAYRQAITREIQNLAVGAGLLEAE